MIVMLTNEERVGGTKTLSCSIELAFLVAGQLSTS